MQAMLRTAWVGAAGAFLSALLFAAPAWAQEDGGAAIQIAPVTVEVTAPVEGTLVTSTLPYSAAVMVSVRLAPAASAAFTAPLTLDDAGLLLPALGELPVGFAQSVAPQAGATNEQVALAYADPDTVFELLTAVNRKGAIYAGYQNTQYSPLFGGNSAIGITALIFGSPEGAARYLGGAMQREVQLKDQPEAVYAVSAPQLGDASTLYKTDRTINNNKYSDYSLLVQRGNSLLILESRGARNGGNVNQLIDLARTLLARGLDRPAEPATLMLPGSPPPATQPFVPAPTDPITPTAPVTATEQPSASEPVTAAAPPLRAPGPAIALKLASPSE